jgi:RNA polymerase sigma factor (sigma-70 family)
VVSGCRSVLRRRRVASRFAAPLEPPIWSAESAVVLGEERRAVFLALRTLPPRQREALVLRYYLDLSEAEIAETMGVSRGTVKSTTSRALAALAGKIGEEEALAGPKTAFATRSAPRRARWRHATCGR